LNKIVNKFSFEVLKKKIWANFQRIIQLFTKKIVKRLFKIWSWDPGSEIRDPEKTHSGSRIPNPGVKKTPDPGSGTATLFKRWIRNKISRILKTVIIYTWTKAAYSSGWPSLEGFGTVLARKARTCMKIQADKEKLKTTKHCR
jgi:hypothetical protein